MFKKFATVLALVLCASSAYAIPNPPAKGQWAWILEDSIRLYDEADIDTGYTEIDAPGKWISVPSAVRDDDNYLWYKVKIGRDSGWLPQNGVRLKMGPKSKTASNLYKNFLKARKKAGYMNGNNFTVYDAKECIQLLGVDLIGKFQPEVRKKLGTPTYRESPADDKNMNILSYEMADRNMTLAVKERRGSRSVEGQVISIEVYEGRTGDNE